MSIYNNYLVCYDVTDNRTRKRMHDFLKDLGLFAIQKSAFWGQLTQAEINSLKREAHEQLDPATDRMFWVIANLDKDRLRDAVGYKEFLVVHADGNLTL